MQLRKLLWFLKPQISLEEAYRHLDSEVEQYRSSVAMSIHAEKLLETQYKKNCDLADTWRNRTEEGRIQENSELVQQATQRQAQYSEAAYALEIELNKFRESILHFRNFLRRLDELKFRLRIDKELILSLPDSPDDLCHQFQSLLTDCLHTLKSIRSGKPTKWQVRNQEQWLCQIYERLSDIDARLDTVWRNWIVLHLEKDFPVLDALSLRLSELKQRIENNRNFNQKSFALWNARVDTATASGKLELAIQAQAIRDCYAAALAHSPQCFLLVDDLCASIQNKHSLQQRYRDEPGD